MTMNISYLLLGGNLGNSVQIFRQCVKQINIEIGEVLQQSSCYESEPWGFDHQNKFLNQVLKVSTDLEPNELLQKCNFIESQLGRIRKLNKGYDARVIDIDILFFNNLVLETKELKIPHPRLHLRKFTLLPFSEINTSYTHPKLNKTIDNLLSSCPDKSEVIKI